MRIIYNSVFLKHDTGMHPESKKRLECFGLLPETKVPNGEQYLELFHAPEYINRFREAVSGRIFLDPDTIISTSSYEAAVHAVGATMLAAEEGGFALVRPPGHHAHVDRSSGFCLFNNVGVAAQYLAAQGHKVFILDFDAHLGDGTVKFFYQSDRVLYWSLHQFPAFPGGGDWNEIGEGRGLGYTINTPLPAGTADDVFLGALQRFLPAIEQFAPDYVAVSAGFDAHESDLMLDLRFSASAFWHVGRSLAERFPRERIFATLEGGYNIVSLPKCARNFIAGVNGEVCPHPEPASETNIKIMDECEFNLNQLERTLAPYWKL